MASVPVSNINHAYAGGLADDGCLRLDFLSLGFLGFLPLFLDLLTNEPIVL
ncbi:hypothetical protein VCRA2123O444_320006 [Vibrio crassostreae]|nr:hypothetical protein VCRA2118O429_250046 [Vibrio crassostreae]CAK1941445.1 hypothetical protein VCRA2119O432_260029 [Vibrio crassostreae]CAK1942550.1 hypothetical protein VCRA2114O423_260028 [Vibrio crassostreae]CAK1943823.1 hypothetical protein VCRA2113O412_260046 [Vibrio crassostreae]CAK1944063.1 hypothetical protein VCRA2113O411_260028 [Vibrio crassostreae]